MNKSKTINFINLTINTQRGGEFSFAIFAVDSLSYHRVLRLTIGGDGSLYLTMMKIDGEDKEWQVFSVPFEEEGLTHHFDVSKGNLLGTTITPKISFHASGLINLGVRKNIYRPPLRTIKHLEQLCLIQYGNPIDLPAIDIEEFNSWQEKKGHPLLPFGTPFPGGILATRIFVSDPRGSDALKNLVCSDFEHIQLNIHFQIRGLSDEFPTSESGEHGYDLFLATGMWQDENWKGPLMTIPATKPNDDPEASRRIT